MKIISTYQNGLLNSSKILILIDPVENENGMSGGTHAENENENLGGTHVNNEHENPVGTHVNNENPGGTHVVQIENGNQ